MTSVEKAFSGSIKFQESPGAAWQEKDLHQRDNYDCRNSQKPNSPDLSKYQLMASSVQPVQTTPIFISKLERFQHIAIDKVSTKLHENVRVIYVTNDDGLIKKVSVLPRTKQSCLIEVMEPESSRDVAIKTMEFVKATDSLYVGTENSLIKIPAQRCHRHLSKESCLNSMDPYCGWNDLQLKCTPPPNNDPLAGHWFQNANVCPILSSAVDGSFSAWSQWFKCAKSDGDEPITGNELSSSIDTCLCRTRKCDNPSPKNGGKECTGMSIMVANCTVNGGWTEVRFQFNCLEIAWDEKYSRPSLQLDEYLEAKTVI
jgi:semaphorin 5